MMTLDEIIDKMSEQEPIIEMKSAEESLGIDSDTYNKIVDECVYGEQKSAWSEEDEKFLNNLYRIINYYRENTSNETDKSRANGCEYWLKSLKNRYAWKPSKEQIMALRWILNNIPYCTHKEKISGLLDQIKDL